MEDSNEAPILSGIQRLVSEEHCFSSKTSCASGGHFARLNSPVP